jgi:hypothetical protein
MEKKTEKTIKNERLENRSQGDEEFEYSTTTKISREEYIGDIIIKHRAYLEIIGFGEKNRVIELGEGEIVIGRVPGCGIQLSVDNVSREHARLFFHNEEYHIEDLGSTNGTYVNGIEIVKCALRSNDQINIGGVEIVFTEEKKLQKV